MNERTGTDTIRFEQELTRGLLRGVDMSGIDNDGATDIGAFALQDQLYTSGEGRRNGIDCSFLAYVRLPKRLCGDGFADQAAFCAMTAFQFQGRSS